MESEKLLYRIEHANTGLGPYRHAGQISEVINKGIVNSTTVMPDIDHLQEVKCIFDNPAYLNSVFAFVNLNLLLDFIKDTEVLQKYGFQIYEYLVQSDGILYKDAYQAIFLTERAVCKRNLDISKKPE